MESVARAGRRRQRLRRRKSNETKNQRVGNIAIITIAGLIVLNAFLAGTGRGCYASDAPASPVPGEPEP